MGKKGKKKGKTVDWHTIISEKLLQAAFTVKPEDALLKLEQLVTHEVFPEVVDNENRQGRTALQYAAVRGHGAVVSALIAAKAGLDLACRFGHSPLHLAAWFGHTEVTKILLEARATVDLKDRLGETPLHSAAWAGQTRAVELLLNAGVPVDEMNQDRRTALHLAAFQLHREVATLLLNANASVSVEDVDGLQAHELADRQREAKAADGSRPPDIGHMLRQHAEVLECEKNIRILQSQARGPIAHEGTLRSYGLLPPIVSPAEELKLSSASVTDVKQQSFTL